jgi:carbonic anhydrase
MAKPPSAAEAAPVLDNVVDMPGVDGAAPGGMSKKLLILIGAGLCVLALSAAAAATYVLWPAEPQWPRTPLAKPVDWHAPAASAALPTASAALPAASAAMPAQAPDSVPVAMPAQASVPAATPADAANQPEDSLDKLQRRLGEALGGGGRLQAAGPGELRLTMRAASDAAPVHTPVHTPARGHGSDAVLSKAPGSVPAGKSAWRYDGPGGPADWARLAPAFAKCASGARQSPIDIRDGIQVELEPIGFSYQPSHFSVIDNGHTVQVNVAPGNFIEVMGRSYQLQQFHFHRPSEERIAGRQSAMVVHLVHKDGEGHPAVLAVLLEPGAAQSVIQAVWNNLPLEKGQELAARVSIDPAQLLPAERGYFTYMGSFTTPPCSEGVLWMVMKKPVSISPEQLAIFARLYPMNARPVQPSSGRMIKESR